MVWTNWSGKLEATPLEIAEPRGEGDVIDIIRRDSGSKIRCVGAGHSHAPLVVTDGIRRLILRRSEAPELHRVAVEEGMRTLYDDGMVKALAGQTTVEEVLRVTRDV